MWDFSGARRRGGSLQNDIMKSVGGETYGALGRGKIAEAFKKTRSDKAAGVDEVEVEVEVRE